MWLLFVLSLAFFSAGVLPVYASHDLNFDKGLLAQGPGQNLQTQKECVGGLVLKAGKCVLQNPAVGQISDLKTFPDLLERTIRILLSLAGAVAVIFLVIGGYQYLAAQGNEETMERAKKSIQAAVIGIVLIVLAFAIVAIVNTLLNR